MGEKNEYKKSRETVPLNLAKLAWSYKLVKKPTSMGLFLLIMLRNKNYLAQEDSPLEHPSRGRNRRFEEGSSRSRGPRKG